MKKLIKWLEMEERSQAWLARKIGLTRARVSLAINGVRGRNPFSLKSCEKIFNLTGGDITLKDLRPDLCKAYLGYKCLQDIFRDDILG